MSSCNKGDMDVAYIHTRYGSKYGIDLKMEDSLAAALIDQNPGGHKTPMGSE